MVPILFAGIIGGAIKSIFFAGVIVALIIVFILYKLLRKKG